MNDAVCIEPETNELTEQSVRLEALAQAIEGGARALQREQRPDGSWETDTDLGPSAVPEPAAVHHRAANYLVGAQEVRALGPIMAGRTP